ncbi:MAG: hypothetical protein K5857_02890 [Lachnospiraceae bacterium]|nr:hypothetical protein [Lachnospiraceae bacterium]
MERFDTLVVITPKDFMRLRSNYSRLVRWLPDGRIVFIGSDEVGELVSKLSADLKAYLDEAGGEDRLSFINENDVIPFDDVHKVMAEKMAPLLKDRDLPRGITGWYYQQFLKMEYSRICGGSYYMSWDGDTVPCKKFTMFDDKGTPYFDLKHEYNELYFTTMGKLIPGLKKFIEASFISEHMLFKCDLMKRLIDKIESNAAIPGSRFYEKIINCIPLEDIQGNGFSEFETYGSFVCLTSPMSYKLREWHSFRLAGEFFDPETISDEDFKWLSRDFDAISFEKGMTVRDDHKNLFDNKEYQSKLSAAQMLKIAQEEFKDGYLEKL